MKKILSFLLVLVFALTAFVSCDKIPGLENLGDKLNFKEILNKVKFWEKDETTVTLEDAKNYLYNTYKDSPKEPVVDYDLVGVVLIDGVKFSVTWTVDLEGITIKESANANFWTVDLPDANDAAKDYTLTATIADADGNKIEVKFNKTLPVIDNTGIVTSPVAGVAYKLFVNQLTLNSDGYRLFAKNEASTAENKFVKTTTNPLEAAEFFAEVVDGGYKFYTTVDGAKMYLDARTTAADDGKISKFLGFYAEGQAVFTFQSDIQTWVTTIDGYQYGIGTYGSYDTLSLSEIKHFTVDKINVVGGQYPITIMTAEYANTLTPSQKPVANDPAANSTLTIAQAIDLGKSKVSTVYTDGKYYVTGTVKEIQNTTYGNLVITDGTNDILVYGTYDATGANRFDAMSEQPQVGDEITVYGVIGNYNGTPQMKNGWITAINGSGSGSVTPPTGELTVVDAPVAGVAYKLGLFHGNENADVFFNGAIYSEAQPWYLGFGSTATAADVYLEEVEGVAGAYRLYFMNGNTKTYIRMYPRDNDPTSGKGTMELTTTCPTEYFTYDAQYKTLIYTDSEGHAFYMGSSGTYKSISTSAISYITSETSYVAHFYAEQVAHTCEFVAGTVVAPTCTADGYTVYTCSTCGATENRDTVPAAHTWVDATCTAPKTCSACQTTEGEPADHTFVEGICSGCGLAETHVCEFVATEKVVAPTCTEGGYTVYACAGCGATENRDQLDALGHAWDNGVVTDPTCTAAGFTTFTCGTCQETKTEDGEAATGHSYTEGVCSACGATDPDHYFVMTVEEALAAAVGTKVQITGTISGFYQTWNAQYNNVSPYLTDATGKQIIIFRTTVNVGIGDTVTVKGEIGAYNNVNQIAQGNTLTVDAKHEHSYETTVVAPTCLSAGYSEHICSVCADSYKDNEVAALGHTTDNGVCGNCGEEITGETHAPVTVSKTMAELITANNWTSTTTKQSFKLDDVVSVKINGGSNTGKAYNGDHIRIYATDTPAGTITITVPEGYELVSIKITTQTGTYAFLYVDGTTTDICNKTVSVSGNSVLLNSVKNGSDGKQVRVTGIEVTYVQK